MASAQVLSNSRKQGHLEAGKKKLEEFRKKKAEGRSKKAASTGQLFPADTEQYEKSYQNHEHLRNGSKSSSYTNSSGLAIAHENKPSYSFQSIDTGASNDARAASPVLVDSDHSLYGDSVRNAGKGASKLYESPEFSEPVNGYHDHWRQNGELTQKAESKTKMSDGISADQFNAFSHSLLKDQSVEYRNSYKVHSSNPEISAPMNSLERSEKVFGHDMLGVPNTSANTSGLREEAAPGAGLYHSGSTYLDNAIDSGGRKILDSLYHRFDVDSEHWRSSESTSLAYKNSQYQQPFSTAGYGTSSSRSRPSFLDTLGVSRVPSVSHVPYRQSEKDEQPTCRSSQVQNTEMLVSSHELSVPELKTTDHAFKPSIPNYYSEKELYMNCASPNVAKELSPNEAKQVLEGTRNHDAQRDNVLFTVKKDEDFASLEQHIEDLTQEKFSLQRALDTSQTLAQSLAAENSSLTDSYNQQGKVVSRLRSDMESLQEEIKGQLLAFESLKMEFGNAQLECSAADERAKMLASEVIGLEEKALRLRSNEIKLEKQLENLDSEITSYKLKVLILQKERQDFQSTIDALQEEKKLLQSMLQKASKDGKVDGSKKTSALRDASTSTEDIGIGHLNFIDGERTVTGTMVNNTMNLLQYRETSAVLATDASISPILPEDGGFPLDASADIPHDQLRLIDNINSLISELSLEREELVGALKIESSNCSKLKDLNKDLSQKLEAQTKRLELLTAQRMATENVLARPVDTHGMQDAVESVDEGDEVVERVLGWIMKLFPGGPAKRRTSKLM